MKRFLPLLGTLLLVSVLVQGQISVSVAPTSFVLTGHPSETDIAYHIEVTNTGSATSNIYWGFRMSNNPSNWLTWVCDKNLCYTPKVTSCPVSKPNVLKPNESFDLQVHMNPRDSVGMADYEINILDVEGNTITTITGEFLISLVSSSNTVRDPRFTVYPNPTQDYFQISDTPGLKYVELFNIVGNKMKAFDALPQQQYYVGDLADGIYLVRLISSSGKIIKTIRLSKR